jgi:GT2 family glycosyltransferase
MSHTTPHQNPSSLPTLSVVVPTYNRRDSLRVTLEGLQAQTYPVDRIEVIVVSDGSTDGTDAFLNDFASRSSLRIRPILQENAGPSRARNRGIREATGDIVILIDDDVEPAPDFLAAHAAHHAKASDVVVIGPMSPDPARRAQEPCWIAWEHAMLEKQYEAFRTGVWESAGPNHFYSGNASLRREHLLAVGGFDETFTRQEDVEMAYRLQDKCQVRFLFDPSAAGIHRPQRTFASWLKVPYAYGRLDVVRAQRGNMEWDVVRRSYTTRSLPTRLLSRITLNVPALSVPLRAALRTGAKAAYRLRADRAAFGALSVVYNIHYLEGVRDELGGVAKAAPLLWSPEGATYSTPAMGGER